MYLASGVFRPLHLTLVSPYNLSSTVSLIALHSSMATTHSGVGTSQPARLPPATPPYDLQKDKHQTTLKIGHGDIWTISAIKKPILNGPEIEK